MAEHYDVIIVGTGAGGGTLPDALDQHRAVNPALTAMANALRVGDHITQRLTT